MRTIDKETAKKIADKLEGDVDRSGKAHDLVTVWYNGIMVAEFGIRRGSNKSLPHGHIPDAIHVNQHFAVLLGACPKSRLDWLRVLADKGLLELMPEDLPQPAKDVPRKSPPKQRPVN